MEPVPAVALRTGTDCCVTIAGGEQERSRRPWRHSTTTSRACPSDRTGQLGSCCDYQRRRRFGATSRSSYRRGLCHWGADACRDSRVVRNESDGTYFALAGGFCRRTECFCHSIWSHHGRCRIEGVRDLRSSQRTPSQAEFRRLHGLRRGNGIARSPPLQRRRLRPHRRDGASGFEPNMTTTT
jgi:hypothetical protein